VKEVSVPLNLAAVAIDDEVHVEPADAERD
jgi:hypothetical protein